MPPFISIALISAIFFVLIPGIGAFSVRGRWRRFRRRVEAASLAPLLTYRRARSRETARDEGHQFRFFGSLEAIQHDRELSLRGGDLTVAADMTYSDIYVLPRDTGDLPDEPPLRTTWDRLGSLTEGTRVFVAGELRRDGNSAVIRGDSTLPLLVVLYDGSERDLLRRSIWSGRQLNEYWNQLTPASLAAGTLALIILAYVLLRSPAGRLPAIAALSLASAPFLLLLPPGIVMFFLYRRSWRRGRVFRAHRDVLLLPLRHVYEGGTGKLPDGQDYSAFSIDTEEAGELVAAGAHMLSPPVALESTDYVVFGSRTDSQIGLPADPMTELTIVPGDPEALSLLCQRLARRFELLSVAVLGMGLVLNLAGVFVLLQYVLR
jgi:hypothetical protein